MINISIPKTIHIIFKFFKQQNFQIKIIKQKKIKITPNKIIISFLIKDSIY